jgi:hypothetical protein
MVVLIVGVLAVTSGGWLLLEQRSNQTAAVPVVVPHAMESRPVAPEAVASPPAPATPPAPVPAAAPPVARVREPAPRSTPLRRDKSRARNRSRPSLEYTSDGVPIMP